MLIGTRPHRSEAIAALYQIETEIRGTSPEHRRAVRQADSAPLVTDLRAWFEIQSARLPGRSPTAEAIRYALSLALQKDEKNFRRSRLL